MGEGAYLITVRGPVEVKIKGRPLDAGDDLLRGLRREKNELAVYG